MSKASEWAIAKAQALEIEARRPEFHTGDVHFMLADDGQRVRLCFGIYELDLSATECRNLARWILDTFGERQ